MANGPVAKLASAADLKSADPSDHEGSIPSGATIKNVYWLAGLLEGEGCFLKQNNTIIIRLKMTDRDIVDKAAIFLKYNNKITTENFKDKKTTYAIVISGQKAIEWMMTLYSLMGNRRKEKIRELINHWKCHGSTNFNKEFCKNGHRLSKENVYINFSFSGISKVCKICRRNRKRGN